MKKLLVTLLASLMLVGTAQAVEFDVVTAFGGSASTGTSGKFYYPLPMDMDLVFGVDAYVPATTANGLGLDLLLGVSKDLPLVGEIDTLLNFSTNQGGANVTGATGGDLFLNSLRVSKKWMVALNDRIDVGVEARLLEIWLSGGKQFDVLSNFAPVLGMTIDIL